MAEDGAVLGDPVKNLDSILLVKSVKQITAGVLPVDLFVIAKGPDENKASAMGSFLLSSIERNRDDLPLVPERVRIIHNSGDNCCVLLFQFGREGVATWFNWEVIS